MLCVDLACRPKCRSKKQKSSLLKDGLGLRPKLPLIKPLERRQKGGRISRRKSRLGALKNWLLKERLSSRLTWKPKEQQRKNLFIVQRLRPRWLRKELRRRRHLDALELRQRLLLKRLHTKLL